MLRLRAEGCGKISGGKSTITKMKLAKFAEIVAAEMLEVMKGGPGSGNFGHEGRPGEQGGSGPGGGGGRGGYASREAELSGTEVDRVSSALRNHTDRLERGGGNAKAVREVKRVLTEIDEGRRLTPAETKIAVSSIDDEIGELSDELERLTEDEETADAARVKGDIEYLEAVKEKVRVSSIPDKV